MEDFHMEWDSRDLPGAISMGFTYLEARDHIVGFVYAHPELMKQLIIECPDEVNLSYIPEGIGVIRTAYLKYKYGWRSEIMFCDQDKTICLRLSLK